MRIVSLLPSATEIVFELGLGDQLDAVTYECDFPAGATTKPVVSETALPQDRPMSAGEIDDAVRGFMDRQEPIYRLDRDLIRDIQPDLILTQDLCRVCAIPTGHVEDALKELGCSSTIVSLDPHSLGGIMDSILEVGLATGTDARAREVTARMRDRIELVRTKAARLPSIGTLALEWSDPPFVAGHWIPEMVEIAGGTNLLNGRELPSRPIEWHHVAGAAPEVVVFMPCGYYLDDAEAEADRLLAVRDFAGTPAARNKGVFVVDASSYFSRPGPRIVDGLEILAWAIHPEAFPEPPPGRVVRL